MYEAQFHCPSLAHSFVFARGSEVRCCACRCVAQSAVAVRAVLVRGSELRCGAWLAAEGFQVSEVKASPGGRGGHKETPGKVLLPDINFPGDVWGSPESGGGARVP